MECQSPPVNLKFLSKTAIRSKVDYIQQTKRRRSLSKFHDTQLTMQIGFIMDNVESVKDLKKHFQSLRSQLLYVEDPKFFQFPNMVKSYKGDTLVIEVNSYLSLLR